jgi:glycosyltransferase involved in cell wall biosynthesis
VSRFEPENNAHFVLEAFRRVDTDLKLVMVGDAPYAKRYVSALKRAADPRVVFTGYVFGEPYRELMSHAYCYVHATEVGGTHPALLEAMGMGNGVLVCDVPENREVAGDSALFFSLEHAEELAEKIREALRRPDRLDVLSRRARERVRAHYDWERVVDAYESLLLSLSARRSRMRSLDKSRPTC